MKVRLQPAPSNRYARYYALCHNNYAWEAALPIMGLAPHQPLGPL